MMFSCTHKKTSGDLKSHADTASTPMMVMQIQKCSKLYTAECQVHKIITHKDEKKLTGTILQQDFTIDLPLGKRKIAIPMDATIKAYIDFSNFNENRIRKRGKKIEILLPDPHFVMTSSKINHKDIKQYVAFLRSDFTDEELTNYENQGRRAIIKEMPNLGLLEMARESAARILIPMIAQMGYNEQDITVSFRKEFTLDEISSFLDTQNLENGKRSK